jgi:hypothetical protein
MSVVAPLVEARLPLPPVEQAAGIRDFLRGQAEFNLKELVTDWGLVTPREGAGVVREYFTLHRLCDATTQITDDTWAPLLAHPPIAGPTGASRHADRPLDSKNVTLPAVRSQRCR